MQDVDVKLSAGLPIKSSIQQAEDFPAANWTSGRNEILYSWHSVVWCWNIGTSESSSEISLKFENVVLEKDGEDQVDRSCEKCRSITQSQGGSVTGLATSYVGTAFENNLLKNR
jgi:hypothetical protein